MEFVKGQLYVSREWQDALDAFKRLCTLSEDLCYRQAFLNLENAIDLSSGKLTMNAGMRVKPYHSVVGWLAMASWAAEDGRNTCNMDVDVPAKSYLFRVAWNLLSQDVGDVNYGNFDSLVYDNRYDTFGTSGFHLLVKSIGNDPVCADVSLVLQICDVKSEYDRKFLYRKFAIKNDAWEFFRFAISCCGARCTVNLCS
ncbi:hypothetical protein P3T76_005078 [Phytophthora citrophthora]|uniref:Uncharacterized protein n=1 Tax=Phytophthora citrophthora TaxID=4793 RepID=A0AAD9GRW4_9STRA|nr:hypothetical protein P3T76_005078 [Phytophthora citrophthora]